MNKNKLFFALLSSAITVFITVISRVKAPFKILLLDRFFEFGGIIEIILLSVYSFLIFWFIVESKYSISIRKFIWYLFTIVFFSQLILGVYIDSIFLMNGKLHFPIPALILSAPIYRMQIAFMPILFITTIILTGPAWCSHLCYFGSIDKYLSSKKSNFNLNRQNFFWIKIIILLLFIIMPIYFRVFSFELNSIIYYTLIFCLIAIIISFYFSFKKGKMIHCSLYCPIGTITNFISRINPFRVKIENSCDKCGLCITKCKYMALNKDLINSNITGINCTICGDCFESCHKKSFYIYFPGLNKDNSKYLFYSITIALHACFIAMARI